MIMNINLKNNESNKKMKIGMIIKMKMMLI